MDQLSSEREREQERFMKRGVDELSSMRGRGGEREVDKSSFSSLYWSVLYKNEEKQEWKDEWRLLLWL